MKTLLLTLAALMIGSMAFSQDLLGFQMSEIQKTTKGVKGIQVQGFGDSTLEVINKPSDRYFKFKIDPTTGICFQEEVQISATDFENLHMLDRFLNLKGKNRVSNVKSDTTYQTNLKTIQIVHDGSMVHVNFRLKVSPSAFMAIRNDNENN
jgi:hypothetical protein